MSPIVAADNGTLFWYRDGGRTKLAEEGRCRMCLAPRQRRGERQLTRHHIVEQAYFSVLLRQVVPYNPDEWTRLWKLRDAEANIVPLCVHCHRAIESDAAARAMLRKVLGTVEVAFAVTVRGQEWFDRRYPRLAHAGRPVEFAAVADSEVTDPCVRAAAGVAAVRGSATR